MFIGREAELRFLGDKYQEDRGQLIVLYDRHCVGKTLRLYDLDEIVQRCGSGQAT